MYLFIDEKTQGRKEKYENLEDLKKAVVNGLDENVTEVMVKKIMNSPKDENEEKNRCCTGMPNPRYEKEINILGITYTVKEVDVVNKFEPRKGEINYLTNEICIDKNMPESLKGQVLMHEILHAVFDLLGLGKLTEDEEKVQSIATSLHMVFSTQNIFSNPKTP